MSSKNGKYTKIYPIPPATRARLAELTARRDAASQAAQAAQAEIGAILTTVVEVMGIPQPGYTVDLSNLERGIFPAPELPDTPQIPDEEASAAPPA